MERFTLESELIKIGMGLECRNLLMELNMKDNERITWHMDKVNSTTLMVTATKVNEQTTRLMAMESISMLMAQDTKGTGRMIYKKDKGWSVGLMGVDMREIIWVGGRRGMVFINGVMGLSIQGIG